MARTWRKVESRSMNKSNNVCVDGSQIVADNVTFNGNDVLTETALNIDSVKAYLASKGCTLWMNWDITNEDGLTSAAQWFIEEIYNVLLFSTNQELNGNNEVWI